MAGQPITELVVKIGADIAALEKAADAVQKEFDRVGKGLESAGTALTAAVTLPLVGFAAAATKVAGDFEASMNRLSANAGAAIEEAGLTVDDFRDKAIQLGKDTQFGAAEALDAMNALAKGGVDVAQVYNEAAEATLNLATAGEVSLASAAEIVAKQLAVWGETGTTAADVADRLAQAAVSSATDVEQLRLGLANVGNSAKAAGLGFDETVRSLALLAPGFSSAADAGTSMKTFLAALVPTTDAAKLAFRDFGLIAEDGTNKFFDAEGAFVGMEKAAGTLQWALGDMGDEAKASALKVLFGTDASRAAAAIAEAGAEGFAMMGEKMDAAGTSADIAAKRQKGLNFSVTQLGGSVETLGVQFGSLLIPAVTSATDFLTRLTNRIGDLVSWFETLPRPIQVATGLVAGIAAAAGPVLFSMGKMAQLMGPAGSLTKGFQVVSAGIRLLMTSLGPIPLAIGAVVAAFALLYTHWEEVSSFMERNFPNAVEGFNKVWESVWRTVQPIVENVRELVISAFEGIQRFWNDWGDDILAFFSTAFGIVVDTIDNALTDAATVIGFIFNNIVTIAKTFINVFSGIFSIFMSAFAGDWQGVWDGVKSVFGSIWDGVVGLFRNGINAIIDLLPDFAKEWLGITDAIGVASKDIESSLEGIETKHADVGKSAGTAGGAMSGLADEMDALTGSMVDTIDTTRALSSEQLKAADEARKYAEKVAEAEEKIAEAGVKGLEKQAEAAEKARDQNADDLEDYLEDMEDEFEASFKEIDALNTTYASKFSYAWQQAIEGEGGFLTKFTNAANLLTSPGGLYGAIGMVAGQFGAGSQLQGGIAATTALLGGGGLEGAIQALTATAFPALGPAVAAAGAVLGMFGVDVTKVFDGIEGAISKAGDVLKGFLGIKKDDPLKELRDAVKAFAGIRTGFGAGQLTELFLGQAGNKEMLAKAGLDEAGLLELFEKYAIPPIELSLQEAIQGLINAQAAMGRSNQEIFDRFFGSETLAGFASSRGIGTDVANSLLQSLLGVAGSSLINLDEFGNPMDLMGGRTLGSIDAGFDGDSLLGGRDIASFGEPDRTQVIQVILDKQILTETVAEGLPDVLEVRGVRGLG